MQNCCPLTSWTCAKNGATTPCPSSSCTVPNYITKADATTKWPEFREAQSKALTLPDTGMAITIDVGGDGHPPDKTEVGERLARLAEVKVYKTATGDAMGPLATSAQKIDQGVKVTFTEVASGLKAGGS